MKVDFTQGVAFEVEFTMKCCSSIFLLSMPLFIFPLHAIASAVTLGAAGDFAVLAGSTVTNTGPSIINNGNVGVSPGTAITGFPPGTVTPPFTTHSADALALQAQSDLTTAYNTAAGLAVTQSLTGQDLGGLTLTQGVYFFASSAQLTGILTLDDQGDPNAQFVFQIGTTLTTASDASVMTINGSGTPGDSVFWQVGSSATIGTNTDFEGHILAFASITLNTGATILDGSALALNGAVTLDTNSINNGVASTPVPAPSSAAVALTLLPLLLLKRRRVSPMSVTQ